jgi:hypothetical protein
MIYNIVKENNVIGKGSFGKIYYHPKSYPNYIVKKMRKYNVYGNNFILNNLKELWWYSLISKYNLNIDEITNENSIDINNITNINFNNIPNMLSYHIDSDNIYLLIEYKGTSIYSMLKEVVNEEKDNLKEDKHIELLKLIPLILYSCSKVLMQLHYANIRHGDITFSNVMYNKNETDIYKKVSIIDWGSVVFTKIVLNNYNQCAYDFMAPELNDKIDVNMNFNIPSIKSDIYSLGIIILYILDPNSYLLLRFEKYLKDSIIFESQNETLDYIIKDIINMYKFINIENNVDKRVFYLLKKMLDANINTRIDIDSLYMDELFSQYRNDEKDFDKYFLKNILRKREPVSLDNYKNLLIEQTYDYLKSFKSKVINNMRNSKYYKLIDTRTILTPTLQLFYSYLNKISNNINNDINSSSLDNCKNVYNNINHYIISFLCCIKWIDIVFNDDVTIINLYDYYCYLYKLLSNSFPESICLELINFSTYFDLTFYNIFEKMNGIILTYPFFMDFKYDFLSHSDIKRNLMTSETI